MFTSSQAFAGVSSPDLKTIRTTYFQITFFIYKKSSTPWPISKGYLRKLWKFNMEIYYQAIFSASSFDFLAALSIVIDVYSITPITSHLSISRGSDFTR